MDSQVLTVDLKNLSKISTEDLKEAIRICSDTWDVLTHELAVRKMIEHNHQ